MFGLLSHKVLSSISTRISFSNILLNFIILLIAELFACNASSRFGG